MTMAPLSGRSFITRSLKGRGGANMIRISARASEQTLTSASASLCSMSTALPAQSTPSQQTNLVADTSVAAGGAKHAPGDCVRHAARHGHALAYL
jgi:hypothetical protein